MLFRSQGHELVRALTAKAAQLSGSQRQAMDHKLAVLKRMVALARSVPDEWAQHVLTFLGRELGTEKPTSVPAGILAAPRRGG